MANPKKEILKDEPVSFRLLALASSLSISQMAWNINRSCNLALVQNIQLEESLGYPVFTDRTTHTNRVITLIGNKVGGKTLHPKLPNIDFIIEISGHADEQFLSSTLKCLKTISGVQVIIEVQPQVLKRKEPYCAE